MRVIVRFHNGARAEALILAATRHLALVVIEGQDNAEEWEVLDGRLHDEAGHVVEIEAMFAVDGLSCVELCAELSLRTATPGVRPN